MKDLIIKTVDMLVLFFVVVVTIICFVGGWVSSGFFVALLGGVAGFIFSCIFAGSWIILTRIHDRLKSIDESLKK